MIEVTPFKNEPSRQKLLGGMQDSRHKLLQFP